MQEYTQLNQEFSLRLEADTQAVEAMKAELKQLNRSNLQKTY